MLISIQFKIESPIADYSQNGTRYQQVKYTYDNRSRLASVSVSKGTGSSFSSRATYTYDANDNIVKTTYGNGISKTLTLDYSSDDGRVITYNTGTGEEEFVGRLEDGSIYMQRSKLYDMLGIKYDVRDTEPKIMSANQYILYNTVKFAAYCSVVAVDKYLKKIDAVYEPINYLTDKVFDYVKSEIAGVKIKVPNGYQVQYMIGLTYDEDNNTYHSFMTVNVYDYKDRIENRLVQPIKVIVIQHI